MPKEIKQLSQLYKIHNLIGAVLCVFWWYADFSYAIELPRDFLTLVCVLIATIFLGIVEYKMRNLFRESTDYFDEDFRGKRVKDKLEDSRFFLAHFLCATFLFLYLCFHEYSPYIESFVFRLNAVLFSVNIFSSIINSLRLGMYIENQ